MHDDIGLHLRDVTITFGGVVAVDHVGFTLAPGRLISLIGPNGAGKTTLLNCVSGFVPAEGSIVWQRQELLRLPAHARAGLGIGRTFQDVQLYGSMTLLQNVLVGMHSMLQRTVFAALAGFPVWQREREARRRGMELLTMLGIDRFAEQPAHDLPFGVQKLAGVARALAFNPTLLLLDEPAAGLTRTETDDLGALIVDLKTEFGLSILLVEHNMRLVMAISDETVVLHRGSILAHGTPAEIAADQEVARAYLGSELAVGSQNADGP